MENQKMVLKALVEAGRPLSSNEIQKITGISNPRFFRTLHYLKTKGLVKREFKKLPDKSGRMICNQAIISINPRNEEYIIMRLKKDGEILQ